MTVISAVYCEGGRYRHLMRMLRIKAELLRAICENLNCDSLIRQILMYCSRPRLKVSHHRQYSLIYTSTNLLPSGIMFRVDECFMAMKPDDECLKRKGSWQHETLNCLLSLSMNNFQ